MSFADPQTITISAVTSPLPRVSVGKYESIYQSADGLIKLSASSSYGRRTRRVLRVDHSKVVPDPLIASTNVPVGASIYMVIDHPTFGYTTADLTALWTGYKTQITASSDLLITKLLGGES
jgi:hypothetical protein